MNKMAGFMKSAKAPVAAPSPAPTKIPEPTPATAPVIEATPAKRGPGRPPKPKKQESKPTTIRLDPDDHLAVRQLALRDDMPMNKLVFVALKDYCARRGVKLQGVSE